MSAKWDGETLEVSIKFTIEEWDSFLLMAGMVMSVLRQQDMTDLSYKFLRLLNAINEGNPNWTPYWLPTEETINGD